MGRVAAGIRKRPKRRRRLWLIILPLLILVGIVMLVPFLSADRYRSLLTEEVAFFVDRPTEIGRLSASLLPSPTLTAHDVRIGRPDFNARADRVVLHVRLSPLTGRKVEITELRVDGLVLIVPEKPGDLADAIGGLEFQTRERGGKWSGQIDRAYADDARVVYARESDSEETVLAGRVQVSDLLEQEIRLEVESAAPVGGEGARLTGEALFRREPDATPSLAITGTARLTGLDSATFTNEELMPRTRVDVDRLTFERTGEGSVRIALNGSTEPASEIADELAALIGTFNGTAEWESGRTTINDLVWRAPGFEFTGDIVVDEDASVSTRVASGSANASGIEAYFALRPIAEYTVRPQADALLTVMDAAVYRSPEGVLDFQSGSAVFSGLDLIMENGGQAFTSFEGNVSAAENVITINRLVGDGLSVSGTVAPDFERAQYKLNLRAETELTRERLAGFMNVDRVTEVAGTLRLTKIAGTYDGEGIPADFGLEGELREGRFVFTSEDWNDTFANVSATFAAGEEAIETKVEATSEMLGAVKADGRFRSNEAIWEGIVSGDLSGVKLPKLEGTYQEVADAILREFGAAEYDLTAALPREESKRIALNVARRGDSPSLKGSVTFDEIEETYVLGEVQTEAVLPSRALGPFLPESMETIGQFGVEFTRSAANERFRANLNLTEVDVNVSEHVRKRAGDRLTLAIEGDAPGQDWNANHIDVAVLEEMFRGTFRDDRFVVDDLDLDVASLGGLLREQAAASGRVTGRIMTNPTEASLNLEQVRLALSDDLVAESLSGAVRISDGGFETDDLRVIAANSDFSMSLRESDGRWDGHIAGAQLDINAVQRFADEYARVMGGETTAADASQPQGESGQSLLPEPPSEPTETPAESGQSLFAGASDAPPSEAPEITESQVLMETPIAAATDSQQPPAIDGNFTVALDNVLFRNATLTNVRADIEASGGAYTATNFSANPSSGTMRGEFMYGPAAAPFRNQIVSQLQFEGVDARFIDEIAFESPRNLQGTLDGLVRLDIPLDDEGVALGGINGEIDLVGKDGTLGSLGFANAILYVFRTTEILFLRSPFGDSGLSFNALKGQASIQNGVIQLTHVTLERPSYRMGAIGSVDLGAWKSEVLVHMTPMSTIADAARIFKIEEVEEVNRRGGIRILLTGPPDDPQTRLGFGGPVGAITDEIRGGVRSVQDLVKDQVIGGLTDIIRGVFNRNQPEE